ncbi:dynamin family protein [Gordonia sp. NB41Y]|uniref:dynamin family protein n=1 Tax=Gordonia sp. NB41Y TaxID=875808 RepID=UPI00273A8D8E|nr:dynamin family protein [Gordonia sp. NB41Y]WLP92044.1 dynamin family protein [Gordonia sp. NB41Y]
MAAPEIDVEKKPAADSADAVLRSALALLRKHGEIEVADRAERVRAQPAPDGGVVVVGEVSRGKSSLVNALVGQPGLAPVDVELATSVHVRFVPATDELPVGAADIEFPGTTTRIDAADLADWVTVDGPGAGELDETALPVVSARVGIDSALLPDTIIVDTPGAGSMIPEHAESAVAAVRGAGVLVMVCDATAPLSAPELDFLSRLGAELSAVVIVVTKTDLVMRQWRAIVTENRDLIARHAPRFAHAPIIGVSTRIAGQAAGITDPDRAARALAASGIPDLVAALKPLVRSTSTAPERNALQVAFTGLDTIRARLLVDLKTARAAPEVVADVETERARLTALKDHKREWATRLQQDLAALSVRADDMLREEFDVLQDRWTAQIDRLHFYAVPRASQQLVGQMVVDLEAVARRVGQAYVDGIADIADDLFADTELRSSVLDGLAEATDDLELRGEKKVSPWKNLLDPVLFSVMASGGPLALIPGIGMVAFPVWAGVVLGFRAARAGKENHRKWLTKAVADMKGDVRSQLKALNAQAAGDLRIAYDAVLEKSLAESARIINEAAAESKKSAEERKQTAADVRARIGTVDTVRKNIITVLRRPVG